jgi:hypothetical protein
MLSWAATSGRGGIVGYTYRGASAVVCRDDEEDTRIGAAETISMRTRGSPPRDRELLSMEPHPVICMSLILGRPRAKRVTDTPVSGR